MKKVEKGDILNDLFTNEEPSETFDFCMCNPPFFDSESDVSIQRHSSNQSEATECETAGGEVHFVRAMILESLKIKEKIRFVLCFSLLNLSYNIVYKHNIVNIISFCNIYH